MKEGSEKNIDKELLDAAKNGSVNKFKKLLEKGAHVTTAHDSDGHTVQEVVEAEIRVVDSAIQGSKFAPLAKAKKTELEKVLAICKEKAAELEKTFERAVQDCCYVNYSARTIGVAKEILEKFDKVDPKSGDVWCLLSVAMFKHHPDIVELLLKKGLGVNETNGPEKKTPLHSAAAAGNLEIATYLVEHGADVNATDDKGRTPAQVADENEHQNVVSFLDSYSTSELLQTKK